MIRRGLRSQMIVFKSGRKLRINDKIKVDMTIERKKII